MARLYSSTSVDTTLASTIGAGATSATVIDATALLGGVTVTGGNTFTIAFDPDTQSEEICVITAVSSNTLTITRALAGTSAQEHTSGTTVRHVLTSLELTDFETVKTNYISKTIVNAKGDILAATADDTVARLAIGTNGQVLAADSTETTGLTWTTLASPEVTASSTNTFTNKSIALGTNTISGTTAEFNTALTDADFATIAGTETFTNKTIALGSNTVSGSLAEFNTAVTNATLASTTGTETLTNKTLTAPIINLAINAQTGTTYTTVLADNGKLITLDNVSPITLTIPKNSAVAYAVGAQINLVQKNTGQVTVAPVDGDVTVNGTPGLNTRAQYSAATCIKIDTDSWILLGDLS